MKLDAPFQVSVVDVLLLLHQGMLFTVEQI